MKRTIFLVLMVPLLTVYGMNAYASSGPGGVFDNQSDSNAEVSFFAWKGKYVFFRR